MKIYDKSANICRIFTKFDQSYEHFEKKSGFSKSGLGKTAFS